MNLGLGLVAADSAMRETERLGLLDETKRDREEVRRDRELNRQRAATADARATEEYDFTKGERARTAAERGALQDAMTTAEGYSPESYSKVMSALQSAEGTTPEALAAAKGHFEKSYSAGLGDAAGAYRKAGKLADATALSKEAERLQKEGAFDAIAAIRANATPEEVRKIFNQSGEHRFDSDPVITQIKDKAGKVVDYSFTGKVNGKDIKVDSVNAYEDRFKTFKERNDETRAKAAEKRAEAADKRGAALTAKQMAEIDRKGSERDSSIKALKAMAGLADLNDSASSQRLTDEQRDAVESERRALMNIVAEGGYDPSKYMPGAAKDFAKNNLSNILKETSAIMKDSDPTSSEYQEAKKVQQGALRRLQQITDTEGGAPSGEAERATAQRLVASGKITKDEANKRLQAAGIPGI